MSPKREFAGVVGSSVVVGQELGEVGITSHL